MESVQFVGSACGKHSSYTFFKAFKFRIRERFKILTLGQFFFVKISPEHPLCVAELQLLWEDDQSKQKLSSTKLYFLPEDVPRHGRLAQVHGEDEVLAVSEKIVLRLEDLIGLIIWDATWTKGRFAREVEATAKLEPNTSQNCELNIKSLDIQKEKPLIGEVDDVHCSVKIVSYPQYYRHRALEKKLEHADPSVWSESSLIKALGGIIVDKGQGLHVLFCKDTFDHPKLFENDKFCNYLAPSLKGRPRKKKRSNKRSMSPGSESNDSIESKSSITLRSKKMHINGIKCPKLNLDAATQNEKEFYADLFSFMKKRNTPIGRIPSLGFKSIDLYYFYKRVTQLGGYHQVSEKRLWKQMFEEVAGSQSSTSAATTTRKHYEKLLLPYESSVLKSKGTRTLRPQIPINVGERKDKEIPKEDSDSEGTTPKNESTSTSSQESEEQEISSDSISPQGAEPEKEAKTSSASNFEIKRVRTDSPDEYPVIKKFKDDLQMEKEKKWEEIRKKSALSRSKGTSGFSFSNMYKRSTVASAMQKKLETIKIDPVITESCSRIPKLKEEWVRHPELSAAARPSVIQHAPLPIDNVTCDISTRTKHSNSVSSLESHSFPKVFNNSPIRSPSVHSHQSSSHSSSKSTSVMEATPPLAHQSSVFKSSIDLIKKSIHPFGGCSDQRSLSTNKIPAHQANVPTSQKYLQDIFEKELLDLSRKLSIHNPSHSRSSTPQNKSHMNMPIINPPVEKKSPQFSPLMSLTSMSAKLSEKIRTSKTVKVQPMINTSSSRPKSLTSSCEKPKPERPVFSVTPQVMEKPNNSSKPNNVVRPVQSTSVSNDNSSMVDHSSMNGHYSLPHYATSFPFMMPPGAAFPSGQFPHPYFPQAAMFGLSYPGMLIPDNVTNSYRDMMSRRLLSGQCQNSMYPSFPPLDSISAQMFNASQHLLRQNNFPSSKSANKQ